MQYKNAVNSIPAQPSEKTLEQWQHLADKKNWRITQLPNGFYQTEVSNPENDKDWHDITRRETIEGAEAAIDGSVDHFEKKLELSCVLQQVIVFVLP